MNAHTHPVRPLDLSEPCPKCGGGAWDCQCGARSAAEFWNGILREHANAAAIAERVTNTVAQMGGTKPVTPKDYRGWSISWDYGEFSATGPNYDASYEGPEDGWVDNGHRVFARELPDLYAEVDAFLDGEAA